MESYSELLEPFFSELKRLSDKDPNAEIFLKKYNELYMPILDKELSIHDKDCMSIDEWFGNLQRWSTFKSFFIPTFKIFFAMKKQELEGVTTQFTDDIISGITHETYLRGYIYDAISHTVPLMEDGLLEAIQQLDHETLNRLEFRLEFFLSQLPYKCIDALSFLTYEQTKEVHVSTMLYLYPWLLVKGASLEKYEEAIRCYKTCFYIGLGILFEISIECLERIVRASKIDPEDKMTQFSAPLIYVILEMARRGASKGGLFDREIYDNTIVEMLTPLCNGADMITKGIRHPEDPAWTEDRKFFSDSEKRELKIIGTETGTEAESLFYELVSQKLNEHFSQLSNEELSQKLYEYNKDLAYTPYAFRGVLINEMERFLHKKTGVTIKKFREVRDKIEQTKGSPEDYERAQKEYATLFKKEIRVMNTGQEFDHSDSIPTEDVGYVFEKTDVPVIYLEIKEQLCLEISAWADRQPMQAHLAREVAAYVIRTIKQPNIDEVNTDVDEAFKVTKIVEEINMNRKALGNTKETGEKEIRKVLNKMKGEVLNKVKGKNIPSLR